MNDAQIIPFGRGHFNWLLTERGHFYWSLMGTFSLIFNIFISVDSLFRLTFKMEPEGAKAPAALIVCYAKIAQDKIDIIRKIKKCLPHVIRRKRHPWRMKLIPE